MADEQISEYERGRLAGKQETDEERIDAISRRLDAHISGCWYRFALLVTAILAAGWFGHGR